MALDIGKVNLISDGLTRTGVRKDGKGNFYVVTVYVDLGGLYPEKVDIFVNSEQEILAKGSWVVPVSLRIYNGRLFYDLDCKRAVSVNRTAPQPNTSTVTATKPN